MRRTRLVFIVSLLVGVVVPLLVPTPAMADVIWQKGVKVSHRNHALTWPNATSVGGSTKCWNQGVEDSYAEVKTDGDYVYVRDLCRDGRSAMANVRTFNEAGNKIRNRYCRNPYGAGTWARCNFNWPEDAKCYANVTDLTCTNIVLIAGSYNATTRHQYWDHGNSMWFKD